MGRPRGWATLSKPHGPWPDHTWWQWPTGSVDEAPRRARCCRLLAILERHGLREWTPANGLVPLVEAAQDALTLLDPRADGRLRGTGPAPGADGPGIREGLRWHVTAFLYDVHEGDDDSTATLVNHLVGILGGPPSPDGVASGGRSPERKRVRRAKRPRSRTPDAEAGADPVPPSDPPAGPWDFLKVRLQHHLGTDVSPEGLSEDRREAWLMRLASAALDLQRDVARHLASSPALASGEDGIPWEELEYCGELDGNDEDDHSLRLLHTCRRLLGEGVSALVDGQGGLRKFVHRLQCVRDRVYEWRLHRTDPLDVEAVQLPEPSPFVRAGDLADQLRRLQGKVQEVIASTPALWKPPNTYSQTDLDRMGTILARLELVIRELLPHTEPLPMRHGFFQDVEPGSLEAHLSAIEYLRTWLRRLYRIGPVRYDVPEAFQFVLGSLRGLRDWLARSVQPPREPRADPDPPSDPPAGPWDFLKVRLQHHLGTEWVDVSPEGLSEDRREAWLMRLASAALDLQKDVAEHLASSPALASGEDGIRWDVLEYCGRLDGHKEEDQSLRLLRTCRRLLSEGVSALVDGQGGLRTFVHRLQCVRDRVYQWRLNWTDSLDVDAVQLPEPSPFVRAGDLADKLRGLQGKVQEVIRSTPAKWQRSNKLPSEGDLKPMEECLANLERVTRELFPHIKPTPRPLGDLPDIEPGSLEARLSAIGYLRTWLRRVYRMGILIHNPHEWVEFLLGSLLQIQDWWKSHGRARGPTHKQYLDSAMEGLLEPPGWVLPIGGSPVHLSFNECKGQLEHLAEIAREVQVRLADRLGPSGTRPVHIPWEEKAPCEGLKMVENATDGTTLLHACRMLLDDGVREVSANREGLETFVRRLQCIKEHIFHWRLNTKNALSITERDLPARSPFVGEGDAANQLGRLQRRVAAIIEPQKEWLSQAYNGRHLKVIRFEDTKRLNEQLEALMKALEEAVKQSVPELQARYGDGSNAEAPTRREANRRALQELHDWLRHLYRIGPLHHREPGDIDRVLVALLELRGWFERSVHPPTEPGAIPSPIWQVRIQNTLEAAQSVIRWAMYRPKAEASHGKDVKTQVSQLRTEVDAQVSKLRMAIIRVRWFGDCNDPEKFTPAEAPIEESPLGPDSPVLEWLIKFARDIADTVSQTNRDPRPMLYRIRDDLWRFWTFVPLFLHAKDLPHDPGVSHTEKAHKLSAERRNIANLVFGKNLHHPGCTWDTLNDTVQDVRNMLENVLSPPHKGTGRPPLPPVTQPPALDGNEGRSIPDSETLYGQSLTVRNQQALGWLARALGFLYQAKLNDPEGVVRRCRLLLETASYLLNAPSAERQKPARPPPSVEEVPTKRPRTQSGARVPGAVAKPRPKGPPVGLPGPRVPRSTVSGPGGSPSSVAEGSQPKDPAPATSITAAGVAAQPPAHRFPRRARGAGETVPCDDGDLDATDWGDPNRPLQLSVDQMLTWRLKAIKELVDQRVNQQDGVDHERVLQQLRAIGKNVTWLRTTLSKYTALRPQPQSFPFRTFRVYTNDWNTWWSSAHAVVRELLEFREDLLNDYRRRLSSNEAVETGWLSRMRDTLDQASESMATLQREVEWLKKEDNKTKRHVPSHPS